MSLSTKSQIEKKLIIKYGEDFKTPLAKELGVNVSTVRRMFNGPGELSRVNERAILCVLGECK